MIKSKPLCATLVPETMAHGQHGELVHLHVQEEFSSVHRATHVDCQTEQKNNHVVFQDPILCGVTGVCAHHHAQEENEPDRVCTRAPLQTTQLKIAVLKQDSVNGHLGHYVHQAVQVVNAHV